MVTVAMMKRAEKCIFYTNVQFRITSSDGRTDRRTDGQTDVA